MADASSLRLQVRNHAAEVVRVAGQLARDAMQEATPRSTQAAAHTADRWTVDFLGTDRTFTARIENLSPIVNWLNDGTAPHIIQATRRRALRFEGRGGQTVFARMVVHPGSTRYVGFVGRFLNAVGWRAALDQAEAAVGG